MTSSSSEKLKALLNISGFKNFEREYLLSEKFTELNTNCFTSPFSPNKKRIEFSYSEGKYHVSICYPQKRRKPKRTATFDLFSHADLRMRSYRKILFGITGWKNPGK